jgi:hypothetical protein
MKLTRVQEAIKILQASVEDAPAEKKASGKKVVRTTKVKKATKTKS